MRSMRSVLTILFLAACASGTAAVEADGTAARLRPTDFEDPECMVAHVDTVQAIYDDYQTWLDQLKDALYAEYQGLQQRGATQRELQDFQDYAREELASVRSERDRALAAFEQQVCGGEVCDPATGQDCPPVCDPNDPQCEPPPVGCDDPTDPDCCDPSLGDMCDPIPCDSNDPQCEPPPVGCDDPTDPDCCDPGSANCR